MPRLLVGEFGRSPRQTVAPLHRPRQERVRRGPYCGAFGFLGDDGRMNLNIAIRTALVTGSTLDYSVGAGIVADSDPEAEWEETLAKAGVLNANVSCRGR